MRGGLQQPTSGHTKRIYRQTSHGTLSLSHETAAGDYLTAVPKYIEPKRVVCAEPSPDVALAVANSFGLGASIVSKGSGSITRLPQLFSRRANRCTASHGSSCPSVGCAGVRRRRRRFQAQNPVGQLPAPLRLRPIGHPGRPMIPTNSACAPAALHAHALATGQ